MLKNTRSSKHVVNQHVSLFPAIAGIIFTTLPAKQEKEYARNAHKNPRSTERESMLTLKAF
jgi:hypothetical protein